MAEDPPPMWHQHKSPTGDRIIPAKKIRTSVALAAYTRVWCSRECVEEALEGMLIGRGVGVIQMMVGWMGGMN